MLIEVMLGSLGEVQMFLLVSLEENRELTEVNLIDHALIKLLETGGFYTKSLEKLERQSGGRSKKMGNLPQSYGGRIRAHACRRRGDNNAAVRLWNSISLRGSAEGR